MRTIIIFVSGRADSSPLRSVIDALEDRDDTAAVVAPLTTHDMAADMQMADHVLEEGADICLLLGDRTETLIAATAATYHGVPIAHVHGGEVTHGSFDNQIRDAVTKLSHIHFVTHTAAQQRVVFQLNEKGHRVFNYGAPGLDYVDKIMAEARPTERRQEAILTWHPPTLSDDVTEGLAAILNALDDFEDDIEIIWTGTNTDPGFGIIEEYVRGWGLTYATNMTHEDYLRRCRDALFVIGNSSSGIIEAPSLMVPSIDVGDRQKGRSRASTVFNAKEDYDDVSAAIAKALALNPTTGRYTNPYYRKDAGRAIAQKLAKVELEGILIK